MFPLLDALDRVSMNSSDLFGDSTQSIGEVSGALGFRTSEAHPYEF
jgi:hypothetical protein